MSTEKLTDVNFTLNSHFTSKGNLKFKALLSLMKQLNVDFTKISDHRNVDFT